MNSLSALSYHFALHFRIPDWTNQSHLYFFNYPPMLITFLMLLTHYPILPAVLT